MKIKAVRDKIRESYKNNRLERLFLYLATPATLLFIIIIPPLQGWDEATHFLRAYQISTGNMRAETSAKRAGGLTPGNIIDMNDAAIADIMESAKTNLQRKVNWHYIARFTLQNRPSEGRVFKYFAGSAVYSPVAYSPQSVGIFVARTVRLPLIVYDYMARLFSAAAFLFLAYWSIKLIPRGKWVLFAAAMLPTSLTAAATMSPDSLVNGAAFLLVALFVKGLLDKEPLATKYLAAIAGLVIIFSLTKQTYFLLAFLPLVLPIKQGYGSLKRFAIWNTIFVSLALLATFGWYAQVHDIARYSYLDNRPEMNINPDAQQEYILNNPIEYGGMLLWSIVGKSNARYEQLVSGLTWKGISLPQYIVFTVYLGLLISFLITYQERLIAPSLNRLQRFLARYGPLLIGLGVTVLIFTALYTGFTAVGDNKVEGVVGRYFIPFIGLFIPWVVLKKMKTKTQLYNQQNLQNVLVGIVILQTGIALFVVLSTNYIPNIQFV